MSLDRFNQIRFVDFEYTSDDGERPEVICMVAHELYSGVTIRCGPDELKGLREAPFSTGPESVMVAYFASAELSCFLALGWKFPANVLDLYVEFSNRTNGLPCPCGRGLLGALAYYDLPSIECVEKEEMRQLAMRGGPYTAQEIADLIRYCESDVVALKALFARMAPFETGHALLRGRYMKAVARMEATGIPVDAPTLGRLKGNWATIKDRLVETVGPHYTVRNPAGGVKYSVYDGVTFKADRFNEFLVQQNISWPRLASGALDLTDDTFRQMARLHPVVSELRELRHSLSQLRLADLAVGRDGRNRVMLSPFRSKTGRNQPSNSRFIFGPSVWLRGLIRPPPGHGLAYIDWSGQEYGIAAALSGDEVMMNDYQTGDPYLTFAKALAVVPPDATKKTHPDVRESFKVAIGLGAMYGAGAPTVATTIGQPIAYASYLLQEHRRRYSRFWAWRDAAVDHAVFTGRLQTVFGWQVHATAQTNPRALANFPMQGNGAEMMRMACIRVTEAGISLCAPVHDALLVEAPLERLEAVVEETRGFMARASRDVLGGFELRTGVETVEYPNRYRDDKRGGRMWDRVLSLLPPVLTVAERGHHGPVDRG